MRRYNVTTRSEAEAWPTQWRAGLKLVHLSFKSPKGETHHLFAPTNSELAKAKVGQSLFADIETPG